MNHLAARRVRHRLGPATIAAIAMVLLTLAGSAGAGPLNTIRVAPTEGPVGTVIEVANSPSETCGVAPNPGDAVEVRLVDLAGVEHASARTDVASDGSWALAGGLIVPDDLTVGPYAVLATCNPDGGGFDYENGTFTVTAATAEPPPATTTPPTTVDRSADVEPEAIAAVPEARSWPPSADIVLLVVFGLVFFVLTLIVGRLLWREITIDGPLAQLGLRMIGWLALMGGLVFTVVWAIAGLVQDNYSERVEYISALAAPDAKYAWLMTLGYFLAGVVVVLVAFAGHGALKRCGIRALGPALAIGLAGGTLFDLAILRSDCTRASGACAGATTSWHHDLHTALGWIVILSLVVASFWLAKLFASVDALRLRSDWFLGLGILMLAGPLFLTDLLGNNGLVQRGFLVAAAVFIGFIGWLLVDAARTLPVVPHDGPAGDPDPADGPEAHRDESEDNDESDDNDNDTPDDDEE